MWPASKANLWQMASTLELKKNDQNEKYKRSKYKKRNKKKILLK